ncbi:MAG: TIGR00282 family metallophosphoesterase [Erysipelotrichaceae bacterium]|nr:TIGR00282 family metallophosphoesterase [Erysipelotrichaceae bacterium]
MNILFLGDITGRSGRDAVSSTLAFLKEKYAINLTIANAENSAHGKGITTRIYNQLRNIGIDYFTMGNHTFSKSEIISHMEDFPRMVTPANHLIDMGDHYLIIDINGIRICLFNLLCEYGIPECDKPLFDCADELLEETEDLGVDIYICDLHGESTAEKRIFAEYYRNRIDVVLGTHTHVQTADECMLDNTAFITDVGMCGAIESIIGRDIDECIRNRIFHEKTRYTIADGKGMVCGVVLVIDDHNKKVVDIKRIRINA